MVMSCNAAQQVLFDADVTTQQLRSCAHSMLGLQHCGCLLFHACTLILPYLRFIQHVSPWLSCTMTVFDVRIYK